MTQSSLVNDNQKTTPRKTKKILVVAHNHPIFFPGGAEIFAYDLFKTIRETTHYQAFFLAATAGVNREVHTGTPFQMLVDASDEVLFWGDAYDYFYHSQKIPNFMYVDFKGFLEQLKPDVIHFHHVVRIGLEAIQIARQTLPNVKIVYTIHEFLLMCYRDGQMIRKHNEDLCEYASPDRCHQCFPEIPPQLFKMREIFVKAHLDLVDQFISPSNFLAQRFIDWGIPEQKMLVMENGRQVFDPVPHRTLSLGEKRNVFGFFGQVNPYKGVLLLVQAAAYLVNSNFTDFRVEIFGNLPHWYKELKEEFLELVDKYQDNVTYHGPYKQEEIPELIQPIDWVVVPSTWWENSPLVIQEVFMHKRPIICSNIGGMAEKVDNNITGLHFRVRNQISLANTMKRACSELGLWEGLVKNIGPRLSMEESSQKHVELYDKL